PLLVVGGPRYAPDAAADLGADKVFGKGTTPGEVASYLVHALASAPPAGSRPASTSTIASTSSEPSS
ncbi:MAG: hypothetical protein J2P25_24085, partial [Nocardiopsaceae bacterium]|nr:hypothetical protein [Nocardiopsaceae bacterium]